MESMSSSTSDEIFQYTGKETIPKDVTIVHFHQCVTELDNWVFEECNDLREVVLNNGLKRIDHTSFAGCKSLERINIPSTVDEIDDNTFYECTKLKEVVLNNGLKTIGFEAFAECKSLERIILPSTVTDIGHKAFYNCNNLREAVLNEGLVNVGYLSFFACKSLESITIPSSLVEIGKEAFSNCRSLKRVVLNKGLHKIGRCAFYACKSLQSITIPSSVDEIGKRAFTHCTNLRDVVLSDGLKKIGEGAFYNCTSLNSITFPSTMIEIGDSAFRDCIELREIVCNGALPTIKHDTFIRGQENNAFSRCPLLERVTFPILSSRLEAIQAGQVDVQNKIQQFMNQGNIEWRRGETIYIPVEVIRRRRGWDATKQFLDQIINWIKYYEVKEATTLFELALWKAMMDQVEDDIYDYERRDRKKAKMDQAGDTNRHDRDSFRVDVPGPVKDAILQYL